MLLEGRKHRVSIFGIGDHNHNLDSAKWRKIKQDSNRLGKKYPNLLVIENCEITFLLGHLLVLRPRRITGTIREGYKLLYRNHRFMKILAHPNPDTYEWHERFVPDAAGIEVINGAIFRKARDRGLSIHTILDIPMVGLYARYLSFGYPVAAIGNSDAHQIAEMGSGLTGMRLKAPLNTTDVLAAIRDRKTFATTDPGIRLSWEFERATSTYSWQVAWNPVDPEVPEEHEIEVYSGEGKIRTSRASGRTEIPGDGLYWIAAFNSAAYAVSSPIRCYLSGTTPMVSAKKVPSELLRKPLRDLAFRQLRKSPKGERSPVGHRGSARINLLSMDKMPRIVDAAGRSVPYEILAPAKEKMIIDKSCLAPCFDEFYLWLQRNEIHEYGFLQLDYQKEEDLFRLRARIVPALMVLIEDFRTWYRADVAHIQRLITPSTRFQLNVRTLYSSTISVPLEDHPFPLRLQNNGQKAISLLVWNDKKPTARALNDYTGSRTIKLPRPTLGDRIFQIFVSPVSFGGSEVRPDSA
jgi:hypothetical protein